MITITLQKHVYTNTNLGKEAEKVQNKFIFIIKYVYNLIKDNSMIISYFYPFIFLLLKKGFNHS